jgi:hypothetical protein
MAIFIVSLFVARCSLMVARCSLMVVRFSFLVVRFWLLVVRCSFLVAPLGYAACRWVGLGEGFKELRMALLA